MLGRLRAYFSGLINRRRSVREADAELEFHIQMEIEAQIARGLTPDAARQAALREFGGVTQAREAVRGVRTTWIEHLWQDVRYSVRTLRRSPAFTVIAVLILGLGIGTTTAAFSVANSAFFRARQIPEPERLVFVYIRNESGQRHVHLGLQSVQFFEGRYDQAFSGVAAHWTRTVRLAAGDLDAGAVSGELVSANYFDVVGVSAARGRTFRPDEDDPANTALAVIISHDLWTRTLKSDPDVIGRTLRLGSRMFTIVGVMPEGFTGVSEPWDPSRFWITAAQFESGRSRPSDARPIEMGTLARLRPDRTIEQAQAIVNVLGPQLQLEALGGKQYRNWKPLAQVVVSSTDVENPFMPDEWVIPPQILAAISTVVLMVLFIALTNIAGVLAARSVTRAHEVAVRQALGAGVGRLVRQLLTESVVLAVAGGLLGMVLGQWIVRSYQAFTPTQLLGDVPIDFRVALFTLALCVTAGVLVGLVPALQARRINVVSVLAGAASHHRRVGTRLRHVILIPQVAVSVMLLLVAGVHVRTLSAIEATEVGYRLAGVATLWAGHWDEAAPAGDRSAAATDKRADRERVFYRHLLDSVSTVPAASVAITSHLHPRNFTMPGRFINQALFNEGSSVTHKAYAMYVSPNYFQTLEIPLQQGRDFDARDVLTSAPVVIVSASLAAQLFPAGNALGQFIAWKQEQPWWREIVGIVGDTRSVLEDQAALPTVYFDLGQMTSPFVSRVIATSSSGTAQLVPALRRAVLGADQFADIADVQSMEQVVADMLYPRRAAVFMLLAGGIVGMFLAAVGIYGVISHSVAQRMHELGIRSTLGADRRRMLMLVIREALLVGSAGAALGLGFAVTALRTTAHLVGPVPTFDAITFVVVPIVALVVILAASYGPARRAASLDPMQVLRQS